MDGGGGDSIIICRYIQTDTHGWGGGGGGGDSIIICRYIDRHTWMGWGGGEVTV